MNSLLAFDHAIGVSPLCGIDEAGRGPLAGPVVSAAVILPAQLPASLRLGDSKKLSAGQRVAAYDWLMANAHMGIGEASAEEIDHINILQASLLAMQRAYAALNIPAALVLIDGNRCPPLTVPARPVIRGDSQSACIAAASIIAKVTRDRIMSSLAAQYPHYGFERHAGYGTSYHRKALAAHGPCAAHRRSFAPVRAMLVECAA